MIIPLCEKRHISKSVCFITKSFMTYSPSLSTISRPLSSSMYSPETANLGSSYNRMRGPGIGKWFSDRSNHRSLILTFTLTRENLSLYTTLLLLLVLIQLSWLQLLSVVQGVDYHSWGLYCRRCYCIRVCWGRSNRIFHFSRWLGQLSTVLNQGWESKHRLHLYPLGGVFYSP